MLCILSQVNGHVMIKNPQIPSVGRTGKPICSPASLESALRCGCFLYYPIYSSMPRWQFVEEVCLGSFPGDIESGERHCHSAPYGNGVGKSIPRRLRSQLRKRAAKFFRNATRQCVPFEISPRGESDDSTPESRADRYRRQLGHFKHSLLYVKNKGSPQGPSKVRTLVASDDGLSGVTNNDMTGSTYERSSRDSMEPLSVSGRQRNIRESAEEKLSDFCNACVYHKQQGRSGEW